MLEPNLNFLSYKSKNTKTILYKNTLENNYFRLTTAKNTYHRKEN